MKYFQWRKPSHYRVTAIFNTDSAFFELPPTATFGELADRVSHLRARDHSALVGVNVMLTAQQSMASARNAGTPKGGVR